MLVYKKKKKSYQDCNVPCRGRILAGTQKFLNLIYFHLSRRQPCPIVGRAEREGEGEGQDDRGLGMGCSRLGDGGWGHAWNVVLRPLSSSTLLSFKV